MCGIVGVAGPLTAKHDKIFKNLLILDQIRGIDSTGIAGVCDNDVRVFKQVGHAFNLMDYKAFDSVLARQNRVLIGHNRFKTLGDAIRKNAHPFEFDKLVGVHNGTLENKWKLHEGNGFAVDSEALYWHMQEKGLRDLLDTMEGAWSLVWWNKEEETLNFLRNEKRPMYITQDENSEFLFWASEQWMLEVACGREGIKTAPIFETLEDTLYSFHIKADKKIPKPKVSEAKGKVVPVYQGNFQRGGTATCGTSTARHFVPQQQQQKASTVGVGEITRQVVTEQGVIFDPKTMSRTPSGKIIEFKRKGEQVQNPKRLATASPNLYEGQRDVLLECLALLKDKHGARYLTCFDPNNRAARIRLYLKAGDNEDLYLQREIRCTVGRKYADDKEGLYYKVEYSSVRLADAEDARIAANDDLNGGEDPDIQVKAVYAARVKDGPDWDDLVEKSKQFWRNYAKTFDLEKERSNNEENAGQCFTDSKGKLIPLKEWNAKYKCCGWCTGNVKPEDANRFTAEGDIICVDCASDDEVHQYVQLV